ncbi:MAG TPA: L,D-transpeptidase family protein [Sphingomicrobium sp.]|nr:L,D-transpeptidase family protein [Sphingomicrobium sp.]
MVLEIVKRRSPRPAGRFVRPAGFAASALLASALALSPVQAAVTDDPSRAPAVTTTIGATAIAQFYEARGGSAVWFAGGHPGAAHRLMTLLATSDLDGLDPRQFDLRALQKAVRRAEGGNSVDIERADRMLSLAFVRHATALRRVGTGEWRIVDREAVPAALHASDLLRQAAASGTVETFIENMGWMHESYSGLRQQLYDARQRGDRVGAARIRINMERASLLPASGRYVLVNTAAQRLYMYENGKVVDWMRVVVGKPAQPTPMMAALIRYTSVNPYWNLPSDLVAERIAPNVVKSGLGYLKAKGYVVLSDWGDNPKRIDPATLDWKAIAAGKVEVRMRQNPGPANAMGRMKFMFPNKEGIYLHDTPNKELLNEDARLLSAGCVRLEDAPRLAKWLYGEPLNVPKGGKPEQRVDLDQPIPVYLAYLTAVPSGNTTVFYEDIYGRDAQRLAAIGQRQVALR